MLLKEGWYIAYTLKKQLFFLDQGLIVADSGFISSDSLGQHICDIACGNKGLGYVGLGYHW